MTADPPRLGVLGTLVWDTIRGRDEGCPVVEEWGGIGYGLEALEAALPSEWRIVPLVKVGEDLAARALDFLQELPRLDPSRGVRVVAAPTNRVELRYRNGDRRTERLTGGVPPWTWEEMAPIVDEVAALYVNFISGFEMDLPTAQLLRRGYPGPIYADLHSLFLAVGAGGLRTPRPLPEWGAWLRSFDGVQMNESEFHLLGGSARDSWTLAAEALGPDLKLVNVTLGARGAACIAPVDLVPDPREWPRIRERMALPGPATTRRVPPDPGPCEGDPTGCGDVWGATFFARLLAGDDLEEAVRTANLRAARNVTHRGARGLRHHLTGGIIPGGRES